jgi:hypothetical protein
MPHWCTSASTQEPTGSTRASSDATVTSGHRPSPGPLTTAATMPAAMARGRAVSSTVVHNSVARWRRPRRATVVIVVVVFVVVFVVASKHTAAPPARAGECYVPGRRGRRRRAHGSLLVTGGTVIFAAIAGASLPRHACCLASASAATCRRRTTCCGCFVTVARRHAPVSDCGCGGGGGAVGRATAGGRRTGTADAAIGRASCHGRARRRKRAAERRRPRGTGISSTKARGVCCGRWETGDPDPGDGCVHTAGRQRTMRGACGDDSHIRVTA